MIKNLIIYLLISLSIKGEEVDRKREFWKDIVIKEVGVEEYYKDKKGRLLLVKEIAKKYKLGNIQTESYFEWYNQGIGITILTENRLQGEKTTYNFYFDRDGNLLSIILSYPLSPVGVIYNTNENYGKTVSLDNGLNKLRKYRWSETLFTETGLHIKSWKGIVEDTARPLSLEILEDNYRLGDEEIKVEIYYKTLGWEEEWIIYHYKANYTYENILKEEQLYLVKEERE